LAASAHKLEAVMNRHELNRHTASASLIVLKVIEKMQPDIESPDLKVLVQPRVPQYFEALLELSHVVRGLEGVDDELSHRTSTGEHLPIHQLFRDSGLTDLLPA